VCSLRNAIKNEDFDTLMAYYTDDAVLVVKPGMIAKGKDEIKKAFIAIANTLITVSYQHRVR
jgi:ketosteroid isomerase-like protein